jgi:hypothetical protein
MSKAPGWRQRLNDRIYGKIVARWRVGELDDRAFERAYRWRAQSIVQPLMLVVMGAPAIGDWLSRDLSFSEHVGRLGMWLVLYVVFALAVGARVYSFAKFGSRDLVLRRNREHAERNPKHGMPASTSTSMSMSMSTKGAAMGGATLAHGRYPISPRFAARILLLALGVDVVSGGLAVYTQRLSFALILAGIITLWGLFLLLDRRIYLDVSPEGVWCRAWGTQRYRFDQFKTVYPRERLLNSGLVLVPRAPAELAPTLSWWGRYLMRSGEGIPAHAGTLTVWTNRVGLDRDAFLRAVQSEIVKGA